MYWILLSFLLFPTVVIAWLSPSTTRFRSPVIRFASKCRHYNFPRPTNTNQQSKSVILYSNTRNIIDAEFCDISPSNSKLSFYDSVKKFLYSSKTKLLNVLSTIKRKNIFNKESITKLGFNVLLSYGWISNTFAITGVIISWVIFGKANNISPLAPGQWKKFLLVYAGVWAANNLLRPIRVSLSILVAPIFEKFIYNLQDKFKFSRTASIAIVVFLFNIVGSFSYLFIGLYIATTIAHVPLLYKS